MWLEKLETELKNINSKIFKVHKKIEVDIERLEDMYKEREDITNEILTGDDDYV